MLGQFSEKGRVFIGQLGSFQNAEGFPASMTAIGAFDFGDVDGDGRIDALIGSAHVSASPARIFRGSPAMAVDTVPPRIYRVQQSVDPASPTAIRFAISDNTATDAGPRLGRAYVKLGAAELEATYAGADLFQATLSAAPQTPELAYTACAVDMRGNESCVPVSSGGSAGTSGTGGTANGGVGGTRAAGGGSGASGSAGSAGSALGAEDQATSTDGGCGCRSVRAPRSAMFELFVVAAAIAFVRRRR